MPLDNGSVDADHQTVLVAGVQAPRTSAPIAWNASAADVRAALEAMPNIGTGNVTVTGGPLPGLLTITFRGSLAGTDVPQLVASEALIGPGDVTIATTVEGQQGIGGNPDVNEQQTLAILNGPPTGGTFTLTFSGDYGVRAGGVFRSTDSGKTFTRVLSGSVTDLARDPGDNTRAYAGVAFDGVYRTSDSGQTWTKLAGLNVANAARIVVGVQAAASTSNTVYAALTDDSNLLGIFQSTQAAIGPPGPWTLVGRAGVTAPPTSAAEMSAGTQVTYTAGAATLTRPAAASTWITDGFAVGQRIRITGAANAADNGDFDVTAVTATVLTLQTVAGAAAAFAAEVNAALTVLLSPTQPNQPQTNPGGQAGIQFALTANAAGDLYVAGDRGLSPAWYAGWVWFYDHGAQTWNLLVDQTATDVDAGGNTIVRPVADTRDVILDPDGRAIVANDGGVWRYAPATQTWTNLNGVGAMAMPLRITEILSVAYDPLNGIIFGGPQDEGTYQQSVQASDGIDNNGDGRIDDPTERFPSPSTSVTGGDGQSVLAIPFRNAAGAGPFDRVLRFTMGNNIGSFRVAIYDATGAVVVASAQVQLARAAGAAAFSGLTAFDKKQYRSGFRLIRYTVNAVNPSSTILALNNLYESTNNFATVHGAITPGNWFQIGAVAYGGTITDVNGTHPHDDVLYAASRNLVYIYLPPDPSAAVGWIPVNNANAFTVETIAGVTSIRDIVLDPRDYRIAYAVTDGGVFKRTAANTWALVSQNLPAPNLTAVEFVPESELTFAAGATHHDVLLVGSSMGVFRAFDPAPNAVWTQLGVNLPNALVDDLEYFDYNAAQLANRRVPGDDVLVIGTQGRGAFTLEGADVVLGQEPVLSYTAPAAGGAILIARNAANAALLDFSAGGNLVFEAPILSVLGITITGGIGDDALTVDSTNGPIFVPNGITFTGNGGADSIALTGGKVQSKSTTTNGALKTETVVDTRGATPQVVKFTDFDSAEDSFTDTGLTTPGLGERFIDGLKRLLAALPLVGKYFASDPAAGARVDLAVIGKTLPRAIGGGGLSKDLGSVAISDPEILEAPEVEADVITSENNEGIGRLFQFGRRHEPPRPGGERRDLDARRVHRRAQAARGRRERPEHGDGDRAEHRRCPDEDALGRGRFRRLVRPVRRARRSARVSSTSASTFASRSPSASTRRTGSTSAPTAPTRSSRSATCAFPASSRVKGSSGSSQPSWRTPTLSVNGVTIALDLHAPSGNMIHVSDLFNPSALDSLADVNITNPPSGDAVTLTAGLKARAMLPDEEEAFDLGSVGVTIHWADIKQPTNVTVDFSGGIGDFLKVKAQELLAKLQELKAATDQLGAAVPEQLRSGLNSVISVLQAIDSNMNASFSTGSGSPGFRTIQDVASDLAYQLDQDLSRVRPLVQRRRPLARALARPGDALELVARLLRRVGLAERREGQALVRLLEARVAHRRDVLDRERVLVRRLGRGRGRRPDGHPQGDGRLRGRAAGRRRRPRRDARFGRAPRRAAAHLRARPRRAAAGRPGDALPPDRHGRLRAHDPGRDRRRGRALAVGVERHAALGRGEGGRPRLRA